MWKIGKILGIAIALLLALPLPSVSAAPAITVSPNTGVVYSYATVNGTGFTPNTLVQVWWDNVGGSGTLLTTTATANDGSFSAQIQIPEAVAGRHNVIARDFNGVIAYSQFTVIPSLTISPGAGYVGDTVNIYLRGFAGNVWADLYWDGNYWFSVATNNVGSAYRQRTIPALTGGYHELRAIDSAGNTASAQFLVLARIVLSPSTARYGDDVNCYGNGFGSSVEVKIYLDGNYFASAYTTGSGTFSTNFVVPALTYGAHTILASDELGNMAWATLSIEPLILLSAYTGYVNEVVAVSGYGYNANKNITMLWDFVQIPTTPLQVSVSSDGSFYCQITVPYTPYGNHVLTARDENSVEYSVSFSVYPEICVSPDHGLAGITAIVNGTGFSANASLDLIWDYGLPSQQGLVSGSTNQTGSFSLAIIIPNASNGTHRIAAKDSNNHVALAYFYLGPRLWLSPSSAIVGSQTNVYGNTFSQNANVSIYWDGNFVGTKTTDSAGDFTYVLTIPQAFYGSHIVSAIDEYGIYAEAEFFVQPNLVALPSNGTVGSYCTLEGTGFSQNSIAYIYWDGTNTYRSELTNSVGSFRLTFTVPEACYGSHTIEARDINGVSGYASYSVIPSIQLSKSSGYVGEGFTVYCHGFASNAAVTLVWDWASTQYYAITNQNGYAEIEAFVPNALAGAHALYVYDEFLHIVQPMQFTVLALDAPSPISPSRFVNTTTVNLTWSKVENASYYIGQYSTSPNFNTNVVNFTAVSNSYQATGLSDGVTYYWRVKSVDIAGNEGSFSVIANFTVDITPPASTLAGSAYTNAPSLTLLYNASDSISGICSVALYYSYNYSEPIFYAQSSNANGAFNFTPIYGDGIYGFYTLAQDNAGNIEPLMLKHTVIVDTIKPEARVLPIPPIFNTTKIYLNVSYEDAGSGVAYYTLFYSMDNGATWQIYGNYTNQSIEFIATAEGKYLFQAVAVDYAGNVEDFGSGEAETLVDLSQPVLFASLDGVLGDNGWFVSEVKVKIWAEENGVSLYYSIDSSPWLLYTGEILIGDDGIHRLLYYGTDSAGNSCPVQSIEIKIDRTPPQTARSAVEDWYNASATINFSASDGASGVRHTKVKIDDGEWITLSTSMGIAPVTLLVDGVHIVRYYTVDVAGNAEAVQEFYVRIDSKAPATSPILSGQTGSNGWFISPVKVELSAGDDLSGVEAIYYSIDGSAFSIYTQVLEIEAEGIHSLAFYAVDNAGNVELRKEITIKIDCTAPDSILNASQNWYTALPVNLTISAFDSLSGIAGVYYSINGLPWVNSANILLNESGIYRICYYAVDNAGNSQQQKFVVVKVDAEKPEVKWNVYGNLSLNGWYTGTVRLVLEGQDRFSGVAQILIAIDKGEFLPYTGEMLISGDGIHRIRFYAVDNAGNTGEEQTLSICIDSTPPETMSNASNLWYSAIPVLVSLNATDGTSGVAFTYYRVDGGEWKKGNLVLLSQEGIHSLEFYSVDNAGNVECMQCVIVKIDTMAPNVVLSGLDETKPVSGMLELSIEVSDISGILNATYSIDGNITMLSPPKPHATLRIDTAKLGDGEHTLKIIITDYAGHNTTLTKRIKVDNTPPVISEITPGNEAVITGDATIVIALDDASEITEVYVYLDNRLLDYEREGNRLKAKLHTTLADNGRHELRVIAKDSAGNLMVSHQTLYVNNLDLMPYIGLLSTVLGLAIAGWAIIRLRRR